MTNAIISGLTSLCFRRFYHLQELNYCSIISIPNSGKDIKELTDEGTCDIMGMVGTRRNIVYNPNNFGIIFLSFEKGGF